MFIFLALAYSCAIPFTNISYSNQDFAQIFKATMECRQSEDTPCLQMFIKLTDTMYFKTCGPEIGKEPPAEPTPEPAKAVKKAKHLKKHHRSKK